MSFTARPLCPACRRALATCVCAWLKPFRHDALFAIAADPKEARNTVGTLALVKQALPEARIFAGLGKTIDTETGLADFLANPELDPWILYPSPESLPLAEYKPRPGRRLTLVVVDGTWYQAKRMVRDSRLLSSLPRTAFSRAQPSEYGFREQPRPECLSTAEAVHEAIEVLARAGTFAPPPGRDHDSLLIAFRRLVAWQTYCQEMTAAKRDPIPFCDSPGHVGDAKPDRRACRGDRAPLQATHAQNFSSRFDRLDVSRVLGAGPESHDRREAE